MRDEDRRCQPTDVEDPLDEQLAARIRKLLEDEPGLTEQPMFGGRAFLIGGHMAVAASGHGGVLVRVDPGAADQLMATTRAELMEMQGRPMRGWLRIDSGSLRTRRQLEPWVRRGADCAKTLPPKPRAR